MNPLFHLLLSLSLILNHQAASITPASYTINSNTNYVLVTASANSIPQDSIVIIKFPSQYSHLSLFSDQPYSWQNGADDFCPVDCTGVSIQYKGHQFSFHGMYPFSSVAFMQFSFGTIRNPSSALTTDDFSVQFVEPSGTVVLSQTISGITFEAQTMGCSGVVSEDTQINSIGSLFIELQPVTNSKANPLSSIRIYFPTTWENQNSITQTLTSDIFCTSISQPSITCTKSSLYLLISNVQYHTTVDIQVHSLYNPSSVMNAGTIQINTFDLVNNQLDQCSFTATGFTSSFLRETFTTISYSSDSFISITIGLKFPSTVLSGDQIVITMPNAFDLSIANFNVKIGGLSQGPGSVTYSSVDHQLTIDPFSITLSQPQVQVECSNVIRPRQSTTSENFILQAYRSSNLMAKFTCCSIILEPRKSLTINSFTVDQTYLLAQSVSYTLNFTVSQSLSVSDYIVLQFPYLYALATVPCQINSQTASVTTPTCSVSNNNLKIQTFITASSVAGTTFELVLSNINNPSVNPSQIAFELIILSSNHNIIEKNKQIYINLLPSVLQSYSIISNSYTVFNSPTKLTFFVTTNISFELGYSISISLPSQLSVQTHLLSCSINSITYPCFYSSTIQIRSTSSISPFNQFAIDGIVNPKSKQPVSGFIFTFIDAYGNNIEQSNNSDVITYTMTDTAQFEWQFAYFAQPFNEEGPLNIIVHVPFSITTQYLQVSYNNTQIQLNTGTCSPNTVSCSFSNSILTVSSLLQSNLINISIQPIVSFLPNALLTLTLKSPSHYESLTTSLNILNNLPDTISYTLSQTSWIMDEQTDITISYSIDSVTNPNISYILLQIPSQYNTPYPSNTLQINDLNGSIPLNNLINPQQISSSPFMLTAYSSSDQIIAISTLNSYFSLQCELPCRTCSPTNSSSCLTCYPWLTSNVYISPLSLCVDHCPQTYYLSNTSQCFSCDSNCLTCDYYSPTICLSCSTNEFLLNNTCYLTCPNSYYPSTVDFSTCLPCPLNCLICSNESHCTSCTSPFFFYQNLCLLSCPIKTFELPQLCVDCSVSNCLYCNNIECLACEHPFYLYNQQCFLSCPSGLYPNRQGICEGCLCLSCDTTSYNCTSCSSTEHLYDHKCYSVCPVGTYTQANICLSCTSPCINCISNSQCNVCEEDYYLYAKSCVLSCPSTTIYTISSLNVSSCEVCQSPCATCETSTTFCLTCSQTFSFHNNTCVSTCPSPLHSINDYCVSCISVCLFCQTSDPYNCTQCQSNYYLFNNTCFSSCPSGTYTNLLSKQCNNCLTVCETCLNATNCTSCTTGYYLFNWNCYTSCPTSPIFYYSYQGHCTACQPQCTSCLSSPVQCTSCSDTSYYYNQVTFQCSYTCSGSYFINGSKCIQCQSPCLTCDTTYSSCSSCPSSLYLYNGTCISSCPSTYYGHLSGNGSICSKCVFPCQTCLENQCINCYDYSYMYKSACVLECPSDMPYERNGFCSNCLTVNFCAICGQDEKGDPVCTSCAYPYVLFEQTCLNQCPTNYTVDEISEVRQCVRSSAYILYLEKLAQFNKPPLFPMFFLCLYILLCLLFYLMTSKLYEYTYHFGYLISLLVAINTISIYYSTYYIFTRYTGQYNLTNSLLPLYLIFASLVFNSILITAIFLFLVLKTIYLQDVRYYEWKQNNKCFWWIFVLLMPLLGGHRLHKWSYSKVFNLDSTAYRIVSVQKFFEEDILTFLSALGDLLYITAMAICSYNIYISYHVVFLLAYEVLLLYVLLWVLLFFDLKKPDRGFFKGDEQQAQEEIRQEQIEEENKLKRMNTQNFTNMIRTKSAEQLGLPKYWGKVDIDDFISVYNPEDYEEVPHVPKRKIQKNIYKGKFRKGKKITLDDKLKKFVDQLRPLKKPKKKMDSYLKDLLYWKPPAQIKVQKKVIPPSEQSMLELLNQKEEEYKDQFEEYEKKQYYMKKKYNQRNYFDDVDETIPNDTIDFFYPSTSLEHNQNKESGEYDDLMNLNYARKKHLNKNAQKKNERDESLRVLHHEPQKKRKNALLGFGNMIMKKFD